MAVPSSNNGDLPPASLDAASHPELIITIFNYSEQAHGITSEPEATFGKLWKNDLLILYKDLGITNDLLDVNRLFGTAPSPPLVARHTFELQPRRVFDCASMRHSPSVTDFEAKFAVEIVFDQSRHISPSGQRPLKLALFDMDSTLINEEVIDELARSIGISDAVSAITARAMNGDIDFATSLKERVAMLKGVPTTVWEGLKKTVTIAEGAKELIAGLKKRGVYTGVISGGFTPMAEWLKGQLGLDIAVANHLVESPPTEQFPFPHLSGALNPDLPIVTPELKRSTLLRLSAERSIPLSETLAVGDGSNDLLMLGAAGLGIAWRAKEKVQIAAPMRLNGKSLADLLHLLE